MINEFQTILDQLKELIISIKRNNRDYSLLSNLSSSISNVVLSECCIENYLHIMVKLYDLSNCSHLYSIKNNKQIMNQPLNYQIKIVAIHMICNVTEYLLSNQSAVDCHYILKQCLQITIISIRICLDQAITTIESIITFQFKMQSLYNFAKDWLSEEYIIIFKVNELELMKYKCDRSDFNMYKFIQKLEQFYSINNYQSKEYFQYLQYISTEILLKMLKKGHIKYLPLMQKYIPQKYIEILNNLSHKNNIAQNDNKLYCIYQQIMQYGMSQISQQYLIQFIQDHIYDHRLFDIIALTKQPQLLQLWFKIIANKKINKSEHMLAAYKCYLYCIDEVLQLQQPLNAIAMKNYLCLTKQILLSIISERKDISYPILSIIRRVLKLMIHLILNWYERWFDIIDLADKLILICTKHGYNQFDGLIYLLQVYLQLIHHQPSQATYQKLIKSNIVNNKIYELIKLAYKLQTSSNKLAIDDNIQNYLHQEPYLTILFTNQINQLILLDLPITAFMRNKSKMSLWLHLLHRSKQNGKNLGRVVQHMEQGFTLLEYGQINNQQITKMRQCDKLLMMVIQNNQHEISYLVSLLSLQIRMIIYHYNNNSLINIMAGININKYSRIIKLLVSLNNNSDDEIQIVVKIVLVQALRNLKVSYIKNKQYKIQIGSLNLWQHLIQYCFSDTTLNNNIKDYIKFIKFEIQCLTNTINEQQILYERDINILKLYCNSIHIHKEIKLKILRKLLRDEVYNNLYELKLIDLKQLLLNTEDEQEKNIYLKHIVSGYGEQGKKFLILLTQTNQELAKWLSKHHDQYN